MSMFDAFFKKGFNGPKCKTLLKLTIPRIKLLRNRRQIQLKQMRNDIAKLLESGQEATARIRVEHIIREENMMAAHEIVELFCELISVRLPIIEMQGECPLDLKEAISTICFAAPRCSDLPELLQVQMLFASKYGKEFVAATTELMPDCGVNRQVIELLSIRAPPAEIKLKLLKEIAEEHELDWDPAASESEFLKPHEDLLNGAGHFISGSKLPLPKEKHDGSFSSTSLQASNDQTNSDAELHNLDLPEVPKISIQPPPSVSAPEVVPSQPSSADLGSHDVTAKSTELEEDITTAYCWEPDISAPEQFVATPYAPANTSAGTKSEEKQFLPFVSSPSLSSASSGRPGEPAQSLSRAKNELNADFQDVPAAEKQGEPARSISRAKSEINVDFQDVLAAAQTAAETAECAAAAARSAASLAQDRITELLTKRSDNLSANTRSTFSADGPDWPATAGTAAASHASDHLPDCGSGPASDTLNPASYDSPKAEAEVSNLKGQAFEYQRSTSLEDDPYFSYPNLFTSPDSNLSSQVSSSVDNSRSEHRSN